jgi:hypothetical protein
MPTVRPHHYLPTRMWHIVNKTHFQASFITYHGTDRLHESIQNIPEWCRHLHSSYGSTKKLSPTAKIWILGSTATFYGDCVKTCENVVLNFCENRSGCFTITTLPFSPSSFWRNIIGLSFPTHRTPLIWHSVTFSYFQKLNWSWKVAGLVPLRRSRPNRKECLTLWQKRTFRKRS